MMVVLMVQNALTALYVLAELSFPDDAAFSDLYTLDLAVEILLKTWRSYMKLHCCPFLFAVRKCDTQSKSPHPSRTSHKMEVQSSISGETSPTENAPVTCSSKAMPLDNGRYHGLTENLVGVLRIQNSSLLDDSLLSSASLSSFGCSNDLSRQNSLYNEPQLSFRNIP